MSMARVITHEPLLDEPALLARLDCSHSTLLKLRAQGLPCLRLGTLRSVRYDWRAVRAWLDKHNQRGEIRND